MKETLKAFVLLERQGLITNVEKAARILGIHEVASQNSVDQLWAMATVPDIPLEGSVIVGSEPVLEIATEDPEGGQRPGVRPTVKSTRAKGK